MLTEVPDVKQNAHEPFRRWFTNDTLDLYVWYTDIGEIYGFQLCYDKRCDQRAITWRIDSGLAHNGVDERGGALRLASPVLIGDGVFESNRITAAFWQASNNLPDDIRQLVYDKLACLEL